MDRGGAPNNHKLLATYQRPTRAGPFPIVVFLHEGAGFTRGGVMSAHGRGYVQAGFVILIGCWFDGDNPPNPTSPQVIHCLDGPPYSGVYANHLPYAGALVQTARLLPWADPDRIGVYGQSQGAEEAVLLASTGARVQAVVTSSAWYASDFARTDIPPIRVIADLTAPLLIVYGDSTRTRVDTREPAKDTHDYEARLKALGKPYEAVLPRVEHDPGPEGDPATRADARAREFAFLKKYLL